MKVFKTGCVITAASLASLSQASHNVFNYADIESNFVNYEFEWKGSDRNFLILRDYSPDLNCGDCVAGGHNFCWRSTIPGEMLQDKDYPKQMPFEKSSSKDNKDTEQRCCYSEKDVAIDHKNKYCENIVWSKSGADTSHQKGWICSNSYKDTTFGLHTCPFKRSSCGPRSTIDFYDLNQDGAIHIQNLKKGEACTYNIGSLCGAPSFKVSNNSQVEIFYAEWQQNFITVKTPVTQLQSTSDEVKDASPLQGMPQRNQDFTFEGDSIAGSTTPKTGVYKGIHWKTWGNNFQGNDTEEGKADAELGRRYNEDDKECEQRHMLISVIAKEDDVSLLLELQSMQFKAVYLKQAIFVSLASLFAAFYV